MNTGSSRVVSGTICLKKHRRLLLRLFSTSTLIDSPAGSGRRNRENSMAIVINLNASLRTRNPSAGCEAQGRPEQVDKRSRVAGTAIQYGKNAHVDGVYQCFR